jgi:hypothetical protein
VSKKKKNVVEWRNVAGVAKTLLFRFVPNLKNEVTYCAVIPHSTQYIVLALNVVLTLKNIVLALKTIRVL